ncbi:MAG TPA: YggS family pyridoxal phosphate-dependent enzyme [Leptolyngbyaceae cyanobacterium M33_DOE_097]|uniref:Pyridoxal phosphate homeostasis protein n=1 Tax=Oscillatoriales cyanobacterium SpSt-418 TaxID=2282169 RepID=A0A7C3PEI9_9CYAN|nr:YggS family pyridoxal phosphate-dependent enzyme [Leptolyngbyaceae cyanobacterium M33_DOE_097]
MTAFSQLGATIAERVLHIRQSLPPSVRLIAISKQMPASAIREAYAAGVRDFGESRVQEAEEKRSQLQDLPDITWHLIGHLQANKVQKALEIFQWIHSVDSLKLAERLNRLAAPLPQKPSICLQVKLLPDPNKYGWEVADLLTDLPHLDTFEHLEIVGLMTILPLGLSDTEIFNTFDQTHTLANKIAQENWQRIRMNELSMGMSNDYSMAVQAGATMIRLGRILFGDRPI